MGTAFNLESNHPAIVTLKNEVHFITGLSPEVAGRYRGIGPSARRYWQLPLFRKFFPHIHLLFSFFRHQTGLPTRMDPTNVPCGPTDHRIMSLRRTP